MLNTREFPEKAGRIYPPLAILEYGQATQDDLKSGKEFQFEFSINYEMEMKESKKDIEVWKHRLVNDDNIKWERNHRKSLIGL